MLDILFVPIGFIIYISSLLIPKNKRLWLFGSWFGQKYSDNSRYFFEYVNSFHPEIDAIWLTRDEKSYQEILKQGNKVERIDSLRAFILVLKAGCLIICADSSDVLGRFSRYIKVRLIQLWHGTGLKKLKETGRMNGKLAKLIAKIIPFYLPGYKMVVATSKLSALTIADALKTPVERVVITGYPRNDTLLIRSDNIRKSGRAFCFDKSLSSSLLIAYLPTCRVGKMDLFVKYKFNYRKLQNTLRAIDAHMIIKPHFYNILTIDIPLESDNRVFIFNDSDIPDIYKILPSVDILITDYSSVLFDYLLLDRPIIFAPFDLEEYMEKTTDFYFEYDDVTPGYKAKDWDDIIKYLIILANGGDIHRKERFLISKLFNKYNDGNNSERVFKSIAEMLGVIHEN